jgi:hypothetical protein
MFKVKVPNRSCLVLYILNPAQLSSFLVKDSRPNNKVGVPYFPEYIYQWS